MATFDSEQDVIDRVYKTYVGKADGLESRVWIKLLKEIVVIDKTFTTTDGTRHYILWYHLLSYSTNSYTTTSKP